MLSDGSTSYLYGHQRLAALGQAWYVGDALGSVRQTLDGSGAVLAATGYDPWGTPQQPLPTPFGFTGELQQQDRVHLRARWYDPGNGTFTARDPFAGFPTQPYSLHPYQYAYSAPTTWVDPTGERAVFPPGFGQSLACPATYILVDGRCVRPDWLQWLPGPDEVRQNTPAEMELQAGAQLMPLAGIAGVGVRTAGGVLGGLGRVPQTGRATAEACINAIGGLSVLTGLQTNVDTQTRRDDTFVTFYRGVTYYDGLRAQEEGFDAGGALSRRQSGRAMAPGLYTSRNRDVAVYFAYINSDPFLGSPGQGGPALMTITLPQRTFTDMTAKYGVIDNQPVAGLPFTVAEPHVETFFPYPSLGELFANAAITIELLPLE